MTGVLESNSAVQGGCRATATVTRGPGIDALHSAVVVVVGADGRATHAVGDPDTLVFARSSIKPFQALALFRSGAAKAFGIDRQELAVACASHSGSDAHVAVVRRLLAKSGAEPAHLACGAHWPIGMRLSGEYPCRGEATDPLRHNCSGKHAGFLAVARALGQHWGRYLEPEQPVEHLVRSCVAAACELPITSLLCGTDGCSAQNYAVPLIALARAAKNLASPEHSRLEGAGVAEVRSAMLAEPWLVSGEGRFDCELSAVFPGNVLVKSGAEAILLMGFSDPPLGVALKVLDGAERAVTPIAVAVLRALGLLAADEGRLERWERPQITNLRGIVTGNVVGSVALRSLA